MSNCNAMVQYGSGLDDIGSIYRGPQFVQRGRGIGSIFGGLWKHLAPLASSGLKALGKQSLLTGSNVLRDWTTGKNLKSSLLEQGQDAINNLAQKGVNKLKKMQSGKGFLTIKARDPRRKKLVGHLDRYRYKPPVSMKKRGRKKTFSKLSNTTQTGGRRRRRRTRRSTGCKQSGAGKRKSKVGRGVSTQTGGKRRRRRKGGPRKTRKSRSIDIFDF